MTFSFYITASYLIFYGLLTSVFCMILIRYLRIKKKYKKLSKERKNATELS